MTGAALVRFMMPLVTNLTFLRFLVGPGNMFATLSEYAPRDFRDDATCDRVAPSLRNALAATRSFSLSRLLTAEASLM